VSLGLDGVGLGTVWGEQVATRMLREAGFTDVAIHTVEGDAFNNYYAASTAPTTSHSPRRSRRQRLSRISTCRIVPLRSTTIRLTPRFCLLGALSGRPAGRQSIETRRRLPSTHRAGGGGTSCGGSRGHRRIPCPVLLAEYMSPLESRGSPATGVRLILHRWRRSRRVARKRQCRKRTLQRAPGPHADLRLGLTIAAGLHHARG
jgi:hypothetical protein